MCGSVFPFEVRIGMCVMDCWVNVFSEWIMKYSNVNTLCDKVVVCGWDCKDMLLFVCLDWIWFYEEFLYGTLILI